MTELKEEFQDELHVLFIKAIDLGYNAKEAQAFCDKRLEYLELKPDPTSQITILKMYNIDKISGYTKVDKDTQREILWFLGIDTDYAVWENAYIVAEGNRQTIEVRVCGQERTDKEWTKKTVGGVRVASDQAQVASRKDRSLVRELNKISNSRRFE